MKNANDTLLDYKGTDGNHKHLSGYFITDGIVALAENYQAFWLVDEVLILNKFNRFCEFQVWKLKRKFNSVFNLSLEDGNNNQLFTKEIPYSDFAADTVTLFFANNVLYLPSEH